MSKPDSTSTPLESIVHIRVPRQKKSAWVSHSQSRGQKLTDWIIAALDEVRDRQRSDSRNNQQ